MKKVLFILAAVLGVALGACRKDPPDPPDPPGPPDKENCVTIKGRDFPIDRTLCGLYEIEYPDGNLEVAAREEGVALTVMADGATVKAELPLRLAGERIDLSSRAAVPGPNGVYYTFYLSERGAEGMYCRIQSWNAAADQRNAYGGWFSVERGSNPGEYLLEWELTAKGDGKSVSTGYVESVFEPI